MADKTTNYGLTKPLQGEYYDVDVFNDNADIADAEIAKKLDLSGGTITGTLGISNGSSTDKIYIDTNAYLHMDMSEGLKIDNAVSIDGALTLGQDPIQNMQAATKQYVDNAVGAQSPFYADIVIASSDTAEKLQANADYVISTEDDAAEVINEAITSIADSGGKIILLSGTYNCTSDITFWCQNVILQGCGNSTVINTSGMVKLSIDGICGIYDMYINCTGSFLIDINMASSSSYKNNSGSIFKICGTYILLSDGAAARKVSSGGSTYLYFAGNVISGAASYLYTGTGTAENVMTFMVGNISTNTLEIDTSYAVMAANLNITESSDD